MKKLLSLLSVLTISGTAVPTTIAASSYQKEETIKNNDINYQQTNNLESLKRNKRQWNPSHNQSGQLSLDIAKYFPVRNLNVNLPSRFGYGGNNPPSNQSILSSLFQANHIGMSSPALQGAYVRQSTRQGAEISAMPGTQFYGSFWVYFN
ncbi:hypothetical protein D6D54_08145 [Spiroplasma poulsonii]|uniref:Uncharacterized protein n=1 Tax=Spiroplasma poulsonii TaxID=2138 RepID=A0A433EMZ0_9MOLU|nr:hypothetical protein [Spiroplasma poulsonii]MBW3058583.1 hypothetical protein [Spiroplasma poulsonii]RUP75595.1 hypothetical protein D6D54_08145 [Spiroplasma poulsonii]